MHLRQQRSRGDTCTHSAATNDADADGVGGVEVKGPNVFGGYWKRPEATVASIQDGWLRSGDAAYIDAEGYVYVVDRWKDMYISGGFNVYPAEVEKLLSNHPAVGMVAVVGIADERMGEVGKAYVVLRPGAAATEAEMVAWSRENMANYKVPRSFVFVDDVPRNASGKVLKTELR